MGSCRQPGQRRRALGKEAMQLTAAQLPIAYLLLDAISASGRQGQVDVSAHAGGALAGWMLAKRWRPWWLLS